jgi:hypothetical protein
MGDPTTIHQGRYLNAFQSVGCGCVKYVEKEKTETNLGRWVGWSIGYAITHTQTIKKIPNFSQWPFKITTRHVYNI